MDNREQSSDVVMHVHCHCGNVEEYVMDGETYELKQISCPTCHAMISFH
ncbi:hypothetical protein [Bacillus kexueae]|nr:hypothetical protein [Bacillus kexueae]